MGFKLDFKSVISNLGIQLINHKKAKDSTVPVDRYQYLRYCLGNDNL